jgi:hypothetical protein
LNRINEFLDTLPLEPPDSSLLQKTKRFTIGGKELTSLEFIEEMRKWEEKKRKKNRCNERGIRTEDLDKNVPDIEENFDVDEEMEELEEQEEQLEEMLEEWAEDDKIVRNAENDETDSEDDDQEEDDNICSEFFRTKFGMFHNYEKKRYIMGYLFVVV